MEVPGEGEEALLDVDEEHGLGRLDVVVMSEYILLNGFASGEKLTALALSRRVYACTLEAAASKRERPVNFMANGLLWKK